MSNIDAKSAASDELVVIPSHPATALALFTSKDGKDLDPLLAEIRAKIDAWVCPDVKTKKGRDEIASFSFKVIRSKTALEKVGKALAAEAKLIPGKIDASRRKINSTLDNWADEIRAPLTEWEAAEEARIKRHREAIDRLNAGFAPGASLDEMRSFIARTEAIEISPATCDEFEAEYARAKDATLRACRTAVADRERYEADQAELARLRAAEAEREAAERAAREAAEREARAAAEQDRRERESAAEAERVEARRVAAEERAAREKIEAEAEALRRAQAAQQRREREEAERQAAERAASERRERELQNRSKPQSARPRG